VSLVAIDSNNTAAAGVAAAVLGGWDMLLMMIAEEVSRFSNSGVLVYEVCEARTSFKNKQPRIRSPIVPKRAGSQILGGGWEG
jgi:hypothetical protein